MRTLALIGTVSVLATPARARNGPGPATVWIVEDPWSAPFSPAELADAIRLRMRETTVRVVPIPPEAEDGVRVRFLGNGSSSLRVERGNDRLLDVAVPTGVPDETRRRVALLVAMVLAPAPEDEAPPEEPPQSVPVEPPATELAASSVPAAATPEEHSSLALSAAVGPALAVETGHDALGVALGARWFFAQGAALQVGAKLASGFEHESSTQEVSIADRAFWLGAAYRVWWSPFGIDLGASLQYTIPVLDVDGEDQAEVDDASPGSRLGLRTAAAALWSVHSRLALTLGASVTTSFEEREFNSRGEDFAELGSVTVDLLGGAELRW